MLATRRRSARSRVAGASLALVGLSRRTHRDAAARAAAAPPLETLDPAALMEWHRWLDAQPNRRGAAR